MVLDAVACVSVTLWATIYPKPLFIVSTCKHFVLVSCSRFETNIMCLANLRGADAKCPLWNICEKSVLCRLFCMNYDSLSSKLLLKVKSPAQQ